MEAKIEETYTTDQPRLSIKLIKGQKENYGWEIKATPEATFQDVTLTIGVISMADMKLRETFKGGE